MLSYHYHVAGSWLLPWTQARQLPVCAVEPSSFLANDRCITPSLLFSLVNWYNQEPFIGLVRAGQMYDVCAVPPTARETLQIFWMRSQHHNVGSHMKLAAGRARHPLTHIHVGNTKPIDVLRQSGKAILYPLKENSIETSRVVMLRAGWWTRHAGPFTRTLTENKEQALAQNSPNFSPNLHLDEKDKQHAQNGWKQ
jgi:hypothetical protein